MRTILLITLCLAATGSMLAAEKDYTEVKYDELKLTPKDYKNKYVTYTATYMEVMTTFHQYMELSGFETDKYFWLIIGGLNVPVMVKKDKPMTTIIAALKKGGQVKVRGKVKEFSKEPKQTLHPRYFVLLDSIEQITTGKTPLKPRFPGQGQRPFRPHPRPRL